MDRETRLASTKQSWDRATQIHNAHKVDQAGFLRRGGSTLFDDELELLGDVSGLRLLHTLCNSGQDTLSLAARGADVVGVDMSSEAVAFARALSIDSGIAGAFVESEVNAYLDDEHGPFDVVFGSYGCLPWIDDLPRFFRGVSRQLRIGGRAVFLEFHPLAWSFDQDFRLKDPYFAPGQLFSDPVGDYVGKASGALSPSGHQDVDVVENPHVAHAFQQTTAEILSAAIAAGLVLDVVREYPYANGCRVHDGLVDVGGHRFAPPATVPSIPLMLGVVASRR